MEAMQESANGIANVSISGMAGRETDDEETKDAPQSSPPLQHVLQLPFSSDEFNNLMVDSVQSYGHEIIQLRRNQEDLLALIKLLEANLVGEVDKDDTAELLSKSMEGDGLNILVLTAKRVAQKMYRPPIMLSSSDPLDKRADIQHMKTTLSQKRRNSVLPTPVIMDAPEASEVAAQDDDNLEKRPPSTEVQVKLVVQDGNTVEKRPSASEAQVKAASDAAVVAISAIGDLRVEVKTIKKSLQELAIQVEGANKNQKKETVGFKSDSAEKATVQSEDTTKEVEGIRTEVEEMSQEIGRVFGSLSSDVEVLRHDLEQTRKDLAAAQEQKHAPPQSSSGGGSANVENNNEHHQQLKDEVEDLSRMVGMFNLDVKGLRAELESIRQSSKATTTTALPEQQQQKAPAPAAAEKPTSSNGSIGGQKSEVEELGKVVNSLSKDVDVLRTELDKARLQALSTSVNNVNNKRNGSGLSAELSSFLDGPETGSNREGPEDAFSFSAAEERAKPAINTENKQENISAAVECELKESIGLQSPPTAVVQEDAKPSAEGGEAAADLLSSSPITPMRKIKRRMSGKELFSFNMLANRVVQENKRAASLLSRDTLGKVPTLLNRVEALEATLSTQQHHHSTLKGSLQLEADALRAGAEQNQHEARRLARAIEATAKQVESVLGVATSAGEAAGNTAARGEAAMSAANEARASMEAATASCAGIAQKAHHEAAKALGLAVSLELRCETLEEHDQTCPQHSAPLEDDPGLSSIAQANSDKRSEEEKIRVDILQQQLEAVMQEARKALKEVKDVRVKMGEQESLFEEAHAVVEGRLRELDERQQEQRQKQEEQLESVPEGSRSPGSRVRSSDNNLGASAKAVQILQAQVNKVVGEFDRRTAQIDVNLSKQKDFIIEVNSAVEMSIKSVDELETNMKDLSEQADANRQGLRLKADLEALSSFDGKLSAQAAAAAKATEAAAGEALEARTKNTRSLKELEKCCNTALKRVGAVEKQMDDSNSGSLLQGFSKPHCMSCAPLGANLNKGGGGAPPRFPSILNADTFRQQHDNSSFVGGDDDGGGGFSADNLGVDGGDVKHDNEDTDRGRSQVVTPLTLDSPIEVGSPLVPPLPAAMYQSNDAGFRLILPSTLHSATAHTDVTAVTIGGGGNSNRQGVGGSSRAPGSLPTVQRLQPQQLQPCSTSSVIKSSPATMKGGVVAPGHLRSLVAQPKGNPRRSRQGMANRKSGADDIAMPQLDFSNNAGALSPGTLSSWSQGSGGAKR